MLLDREEGRRVIRRRRFRLGVAAVAALAAAFAAQRGADAQVVQRDTVMTPIPTVNADKDKQKDKGRGQTTAAQPVATADAKQDVTSSIAPQSLLPVPPADPALAGIALDPSWPKQLYVIGDSVMLGAATAMVRGFPDWRVTMAGKPALMIPKAIEELPPGGPLGSVAVIAIGYNTLWQRDRQNFKAWSDLFDKGADTLIAALKQRGVRKIVWVMLREINIENIPRSSQSTQQLATYGWYFPYVNERLRALKERHPEIALADWTTAARQGGVTYDIIHLNDRGAELMTDVVRVAVGLEPREAARPVVTAGLTPIVSAENKASPPPAPAAPAAPPKPAAEQTGPAAKKGEPAATPAAPPAPMKTTYAFRDCAACPEMVVVPAGSFMMGSPENETDRNDNESPQRLVTIARPFAVGKFEVTFAEWKACVAGGGCKGNPNPGDEGWGRDTQPVINVSWTDAMEYVAWLSRTTGKPYRLLTEAEWEYAARAGTSTPFSTGATITTEQANFQPNYKADGETREGEYRERTVKVGSFPANAWELHDMNGNAWEWVADNWHDTYQGAPADGSVFAGGDKTQRVQRGGSWYSFLGEMRSANRHADVPNHRGGDIGFRVARGL